MAARWIINFKWHVKCDLEKESRIIYTLYIYMRIYASNSWLMSIFDLLWVFFCRRHRHCCMNTIARNVITNTFFQLICLRCHIFLLYVSQWVEMRLLVFSFSIEYIALKCLRMHDHKTHRLHKLIAIYVWWWFVNFYIFLRSIASIYGCLMYRNKFAFWLNVCLPSNFIQPTFYSHCIWLRLNLVRLVTPIL